MKLLATLLNCWLVLFVLNAAGSLVDELVHLLTGWHVLSILLLPIGLLLLVSMPLMWAAMLASPRVPKSVFGPILAMLVWSVLGAMPLPIFLGVTGFALPLSLISVAVAVAVVARTRQLNQGERWLFTEELFPECPFFSATNAIVIAAVTFVGGPPALLTYGYVSADLACNVYSGDFVGLNPSGFEIVHKQYTKGDKTIDLIGMAHLGDKAVYDVLFDAIEPHEKTILLAEGVADTEGHLGSGPLYDKMAERIGLSTQKPMGQMTEIKVRNADIDVKDFSPETLEILALVLEIYRADDPLPPLIAYITFAQGQDDPEAMGEQVYEDLITLRNDSLWDHMTSAQTDHDRLVVPWGAYHLKDIEERVLGDGFTEVSEIRHTLVPFRLLLGG